MIKVEPPGEGDPIRGWRLLDDGGTAYWWRSLARNKKSVTAYLRTDVGPVIDEEALGVLKAHEERIIREGRLIHRCQLGAGTENGTFFAPLAVEIDGLAQLPTEVFGPVLHVVRYRARDLDAVIDQINNTGYGLTLGIHSRIDSQAQDIAHRIRVGNVYINRNQVGAVVGVGLAGGVDAAACGRSREQ